MKLHFKRTSKEARCKMSEAAKNIDYASNKGHDEINLAKKELNFITNHEHVKVLNSGNSAILAAMSNFKDKIIIPDQGGWRGFKDAAKFLNLQTIEIPTDLGIVNPDTLEEYLNRYRPDALFITSFAGYIAEQPVKQLYEVCEDNNVILVEDASGAIGDKKMRLCNGDHAHIIVASTGSPKIVNVGNGGFISTNNNFFKKSNFILKTLSADPVTCAGIAEEIKSAPEVLSKNINVCNLIKKKLKSTIHKNKRSITICIKNDNPKRIAYSLRKKLNVQGGNIITTCPRYERLMIDAICLEIKNLDPLCMENATIRQLVQIVKQIID